MVLSVTNLMKCKFFLREQAGWTAAMDLSVCLDDHVNAKFHDPKMSHDQSLFFDDRGPLVLS